MCFLILPKSGFARASTRPVFERNSAQNATGVDMDKDYRKLETEEVRTHVSWLKRKPNFDVTICLHEDHTTKGFYVREMNPDDAPSPGKRNHQPRRRRLPD